MGIKELIKDMGTGMLAASFTLFILFAALMITTGYPSSIMFKAFEAKASTDSINNIVAELCNTHNTNMSKAKCVIEFFSSHYEFVKHNETFRPATEFIVKGGVCRDFAINVCAVLNKMDIECSYVFTPNHVFPKFDIDEGYCIFDDLWWCNNV